eukprot:COSAG01_NODE_38369_length_490_cov_1.608696_1_plen_108_part_10
MGLTGIPFEHERYAPVFWSHVFWTEVQAVLTPLEERIVETDLHSVTAVHSRASLKFFIICVYPYVDAVPGVRIYPYVSVALGLPWPALLRTVNGKCARLGLLVAPPGR